MKNIFNFGKLLEGESMNADEAYSVATYNEVVTQETLVKRFLDTTDQLIKAKSENNYCSILLIALTVVWTILKTQCWKNYLWLN